MQLNLESILAKRFNYTERVNMDDFTEFCKSYFTAVQSSIVTQYFSGTPTQVLVSRHHLAESRIHNLAYLSVDRYYSLKLKGANNDKKSEAGNNTKGIEGKIA